MQSTGHAVVAAGGEVAAVATHRPLLHFNKIAQSLRMTMIKYGRINKNIEMNYKMSILSHNKQTFKKNSQY